MLSMQNQTIGSTQGQEIIRKYVMRVWNRSGNNVVNDITKTGSFVRRILHKLGIIACAPLLVSCADVLLEPDVDDDPSYVQGGRIGVNFESVSKLRRSIPLNLLNPDDKLAFRGTYVTRDAVTNSDYGEIVIAVENVTPDETLCFLQLLNVDVLNHSGAVINTSMERSTYLTAKRKQVVGTGELTATCLAPQEKGYFFPSSQGLYGSIASIRIDAMSYEVTQVQAPLSEIVWKGTYAACQIEFWLKSFS